MSLICISQIITLIRPPRAAFVQGLAADATTGGPSQSAVFFIEQVEGGEFVSYREAGDGESDTEERGGIAKIPRLWPFEQSKRKEEETKRVRECPFDVSYKQM